MKKVRIVRRARLKGDIYIHPGEAIEVSNRKAALLIHRGIAKEAEDESVAVDKEEVPELQDSEAEGEVIRDLPESEA